MHIILSLVYVDIAVEIGVRGGFSETEIITVTSVFFIQN